MKKPEWKSRLVPEDYHVHSCFSDGKCAPEEIILEAIRLGMTDLGFSDHAWTSFDESYCMKPEQYPEYRRSICALREKYAGSIRIYLGIEQDYYSSLPAEDFDYVIGSVHFVKKDGEYLPVDLSAKSFEENVARCYGGDYYAFAEDYYAVVSDIPSVMCPNVIGHLDLVTKFNEGDRLFSTTDERYLKAAFSAVNKLLPLDIPFEINTGVVSRGYRTTPYPSPVLIEYIKAHGGRLILSSDSHDKSTLMYRFEEVQKYL